LNAKLSSLSAIEALHRCTSESLHPLTQNRRTSRRLSVVMTGETSNPTGLSLLSAIEEKKKICSTHSEVIQFCKRNKSITCDVAFTEYIVGFQMDNFQQIFHQGFIKSRDEILASSSLRPITTISTAINQLLSVPMLVSKDDHKKSYINKIWNYSSKQPFPNLPKNYSPGKHQFTLKLLQRFEEKKESAIVVSLLVDELKCLAAELKKLGLKHILISAENYDDCKNLCKNQYEEIFVVILITYGLALSLNLQFCSKLIFMAPSWNDLTLKQAAGRIIR